MRHRPRTRSGYVRRLSQVSRQTNVASLRELFPQVGPARQAQEEHLVRAPQALVLRRPQTSAIQGPTQRRPRTCLWTRTDVGGQTRVGVRRIHRLHSRCESQAHLFIRAVVPLTSRRIQLLDQLDPHPAPTGAWILLGTHLDELASQFSILRPQFGDEILRSLLGDIWIGPFAPRLVAGSSLTLGGAIVGCRSVYSSGYIRLRAPTTSDCRTRCDERLHLKRGHFSRHGACRPFCLR